LARPLWDVRHQAIDFLDETGGMISVHLIFNPRAKH
jgi:hypothetical protein